MRLFLFAGALFCIMMMQEMQLYVYKFMDFMMVFFCTSTGACRAVTIEISVLGKSQRKKQQ
jgi:hypothetical protein